MEKGKDMRGQWTPSCWSMGFRGNPLGFQTPEKTQEWLSHCLSWTWAMVYV